MPIQNFLPARQTRSQAVLTETPRAPLDGTPEVPKLRAQLDRGPHIEGAAPSRKEERGPRRSSSFSGVVGGFPGASRTFFKCTGEDGEEEEENSVEEEGSDGTEGAPAPVWVPKMTQRMANLKADSSPESSRPPAFETPSMKAPECFDRTQPFKVRSFIHSCQSIFHNGPVNLSQDRKNILIDSGATNPFIAKQVVHKYSLTTSELPEKISLIILDSSESPSLFVTHHNKYMVELPSFPSFEWEFLVIDTPKGEYLIFGFDFLNSFNPSIHWRKGLITLNDYQKDYSDPSNTFSNDFSSAKSCVALVDDSRTPSFPSSVHIPSLNSHPSLLSSRDEVFKEIQDVGEDHSVSSLHLFFGSMDLPSSSYHDSPEELWDEEEEPEEVKTVLKVFPSVYHQYLDVFSKVKEEMLPPHHACDHHIELEGSLHPVGVIYSLSNQESDTLRS
ncbi:hypothetical protein O181_002458 [Austropuccinia psidii MF-1]|uniref:Peptidase A2 domain-containing protein n=1 Tax=Austropuccinia psidii MF-1 TaxID=1389203 RepID=A0A9Q3GCN1_9BASI|nr:hypothetical protein [Austropuccinia psidii MF-1]